MDEELIDDLFSFRYLKFLLFLFLIVILLQSDVVIDKVLTPLQGTTHKIPNSKGVVIIGLGVVILAAIVDLVTRLGFP